MRILITGSSGQIGTNLGLHLQDQGHYVCGVDKRENDWTSEIETLYQDLSIPYKDFSSGIGDVEFPENLDVVVHFAAHAKVHELVLNPARALENITMTFNALEFCRKNKLPIIFSSSREVYGDIQRELTNESDADFGVAESPYSASKISGEALIYSYAQCYDIPYLVFRFSNVYGRYDNDIERMLRVIPHFIRSINNEDPITVFGESKVLDFTYVDDCVRGVASGIERLVSGQVKNQTINLAFGKGNSLVDMTRFIAEELNKEPNMTIKPARVGEVTHYVADISKAEELLGYSPEVSLREGLKRSVEWSLDWWSKEK